MAQPNSSKPLSTVSINSLKPDNTLAGAGEYRGLRVECGKRGSKSFVYRYRSPVSGKVKQYKIGNYQASNLSGEKIGISLAEAQVQFLGLRAERDAGVCLVERKKTQAADARSQAERITVEQAVSYYMTTRVEKTRTTKAASECRRTLYGDLKILASMLLEEVTSQDVLSVVEGILERGANVQAGFFLRELTAAFNSSLPMEAANPCYRVKEHLKMQKIRLNSKRGKRAFNDVEISTFLRWLPGSHFTQGQKAVMTLTLLTAVRSGEACSLKWQDLDLDRAVWHLSETKTGDLRDVQLSTQAVNFLRGQQLLGVTEGPVIRNIKGRAVEQKSLGETAWRMRRDKQMIDLPAWTAHDLRRTVRTQLAAMKCPSAVAEAVLGHSNGGIEGVYNLHRYNDECREWLQKWADRLDGLASTDKVVSTGSA